MKKPEEMANCIRKYKEKVSFYGELRLNECFKNLSKMI